MTDEELLDLNRRMIDLHNPGVVEITTCPGEDGTRNVWLNVNGVCVFRAKNVSNLVVEQKK